jgi:phage terminase small subunit
MSKQGATRKGVLTGKQVRFIDEYLVDLNATQSAIRAGYSKKTAAKIGFETLQKPEIAKAIEAKRKELAAGLGITREKVLQEMAKLAFSDVRKLFDAHGQLLHPTKWPEEAAGAVAGMDLVEEWGEKKDGDGKEVIGYTKKLKLWDKGKQLENLLKHLGMAEDKPPETGVPTVSPGLAAVIAKLEGLTTKEAA